MKKYYIFYKNKYTLTQVSAEAYMLLGEIKEILSKEPILKETGKININYEFKLD